MHSQNGKDKEMPQCTSELDNELCPTVQLLSKILPCDGEQVDHSKILLREQVEQDLEIERENVFHDEEENRINQGGMKYLAGYIAHVYRINILQVFRNNIQV